MVLIAYPSIAQKVLFTGAHCTIVYSLNRYQDKDFNDEINQLSAQINMKNIQLADLNNWRKSPPHVEISGRFRNQFRQHYAMQKGVSQVLVLNEKGKVLNRYSGSVTLVNALLDCG